MLNSKQAEDQFFNKLGTFDSAMYTHNLPYGIRKSICNLLDADGLWRRLGGQFLGLNTTDLTLIGQAYMRNGSPTEELLNKLDSANVKVTELCSFLRQMNHNRALEILRPYNNDQSVVDSIMSATLYAPIPTSLDTPTPSFIEQPAIMADEQTHYGQPQDDWLFAGEQQYHPQNVNVNHNSVYPNRHDLMAAKNQNILMDHQRNDLHLQLEQIQQLQSRPQVQHEEQQQQLQRNLALDKQQGSSSCHNRNLANFDRQQPMRLDNQQAQDKLPDPGEEIVRMACANNRKRTSISDQEVVNQLRLIMQITYKELKQASNDFSTSNILGNGGFASVYRGNWKGTDVAIKRLKCNLMDQALNELTILNSYRIDNILPIYGISIDGPEACLVYQFMANGSLEDRLSCKRGTPPLSWTQRAFIGEGVAKGLFYLHTLRDKPLVHGDVKSANVLLDSQFVPKLGDFGLARQVFKARNPQSELCTHCTVSSIHGTSVYLPSEYLRHKILSPAVDVYSYGIVLLEMATGKRAYDGKKLLIDLVEDETRSMSPNKISQSLKDPRPANETQTDFAIWYELLIKLGLNCAHKIKKKRPDMGKVLSRFVDFRSSSESTRGDTSNPIKRSILSDGSTVEKRSLTPDLNTLNYRNHQQQQLFLQQQHQHIAQPQVNSKQPQVTLGEQVVDQSLKLMSVEEDNNQFIDNGAQTYRNEAVTGEHQRATSLVNNYQEEPQSVAVVEDMIPLLTELGIVVTNQDHP